MDMTKRETLNALGFKESREEKGVFTKEDFPFEVVLSKYDELHLWINLEYRVAKNFEIKDLMSIIDFFKTFKA